ncbi:MAG: GatB/YqeY domain-containing protein [Thermodesulfobacteriota bacterium]
MNLKERIKEDMVNALRNKSKLELSALRMVQSAIKNKEIELRKGEEALGDEEVAAVVSSEIKKRKEAIEHYTKAHRQDLVDGEKAELDVLTSYMPEQMGEDEIRELVKKAIEEVGAQGPSDMGKVMKSLMQQVKGKADGATANRIVKEEPSEQMTRIRSSLFGNYIPQPTPITPSLALA